MINWTTYPLLVLTGLWSSALGKPLPTHDVYQAEENSNITLKWIYPVNTTVDQLFIDLMAVESQRCLYRYDSRINAEYTDELFRSRLQCFPQLVRKGRIQCGLTDVKLNDTGIYQLIINVNGKADLKRCQLIVRASVLPTSSQSPNPENRERFCLVGVGLFLVVLVLVCLIIRIFLENKPK